MRFVLLTLTLFLLLTPVHGQNLIGYKAKDITSYMKLNHSDMNSNKVTNPLHSYLKYSDSMETETVIFFLRPDSVCSSVRITCEPALKRKKIVELDTKYKKNGDMNWIDFRDGKKYNITMKNDSWSCVISIDSEK
jgi:hypothetical protein